MSKYTFPTSAQVASHWRAQEVSIFRPPGSQDRGFKMVNSWGEVKEVLSMEIEGKAVELFKQRQPAETRPDPMARAQQLIQWHHRKGLTAEEFAAEVKTPSEHLLHLILYGNMTDSQRAQNLVKLSKLLFDEQKHEEEKLHRDRQVELKKTDQLLRAQRMMDQMLASKARASGEQSE